MTVFTKDVFFEYGCNFKTELQINSFNNGYDLLLGSIVKKDNRSSALYLGKMAEVDLMSTNVWLDTESAHVVYIIGSRRGGKSYTLGVIAEGLSNSSMSTTALDNAVLIIDSLNLYWTMEFAAVDENEKRNLREWGLEPTKMENISIYYPRGHKKDWMNEYDHYKEFSISTADIDVYDLADLFELNIITEPQGQILSEIFGKVKIDGYIGPIGRVPPKQKFSIKDLISCLDNDSDLTRYADSTREAVRRRLKALEDVGIISDEGTNIKELFERGKITDLLLMDLDQQVRGLIVGVLIRKIFRMRGETTSYEKKLKILESESNNNSQKISEIKSQIENGVPRGWILIDEGHNYMPANHQIGSLKPLTQYVNEGRNLGLSLAITTQNPSGIHTSVQRNADILVIHKIGITSDLQAAEGMLRNSVPDQVFLNGKKYDNKIFDKVVREEQLGYALVSAENSNRVLYVHIRPRLTMHGGLNY